MAKILFEYWKFPVNGALQPNGSFFVDGDGYYRISNEFGRAMGRTICPCCGTVVDFYILSMAGSGKRCPVCRIRLNFRGAYLGAEEITPFITVSATQITKRNIRRTK
jgi:hypothetical protein